MCGKPPLKLSSCEHRRAPVLDGSGHAGLTGVRQNPAKSRGHERLLNVSAGLCLTF